VTLNRAIQHVQSRFSFHFQRYLGIEPGEQMKVLLLFTYFFVVIAAFWIQKPIRTSKFLVVAGPEALPLIKLATAFLILPIVLLYSSLVRRYCRECMVAGCVAVFATASLIFWYFFSFGAGDWVSYVYFFYVDIFITIMVALFWSFANDLTPPSQARRVYGFVGAGGILGGVAGSAVTGFLSESLGSANLLLVCTLLLGLIALLARFSMQACALPMPTIRHEQPLFSLKAAFDGARFTLTRPYLISIAIILGFYEIVSNIVDYQFNFAAAQFFFEEHQLSAFLGKLSTVIILASLVFQVILTTWVLRRFGPKVGLLILPFILGLGSMFFLAFPLFSVAALMFSSDGSLHYSVNQTSKEVLYTPTDEATKYQAKAFIDMFLFRFAKGLSALIILFCNFFLIPMGWQIQHFGLLSLIFIGIWVVAAFFAGYRFQKLAQPERQPI